MKAEQSIARSEECFNIILSYMAGEKYQIKKKVKKLNLKAPKGIDVESWFIECYRKHKGHPMQILLGLYKGNYHKFFLAVIFFFIKHAPVWVLL